jgi:hypothetical protein
VAQTPASDERLTVLIDGKPIGMVAVRERTPRKVYGKFTPAPAFEPYRPVFETAIRLAREYDATPSKEPIDYALFDRLMLAYAEISRLHPTFAELSISIEEFAVEPEWTVEVTFGVPPD